MKKLYTAAFYNLETLFDTMTAKILDDDFTPNTEIDWKKHYNKKLKKLGRIISQIGFAETTHPAVLSCVSKVENEPVVLHTSIHYTNEELIPRSFSEEIILKFCKIKQ
ncbi:hypothetical protein [Aequorivita lipolytica]|uniref:Endonuclease/exonuclease/phosphatase domain-containing protein n=1 Tax=Aequorivita lipolytica TaxID=153267 RepID=A0A5C6YSQ4_9FLAO|nr:hypothetical protein [Aequorivita lipolytica]TXD70082.1 hypothetical protein ESV24_02620 [Aequorivita lipolytica]SRX50492.1 hypothetical protein AEQU2_00965 [Aequorivita lipolytica]